MIKKWAVEQLIRLLSSAIYDGMSQGADQIIATAAKELGIPIVCCYPFPKKIFHPVEQWITENNQIIFVSPQYSKDAYNIRDRFMVDHAAKLLCVWDGIGWGGTFLTRNYALQQGKEIIDYGGFNGMTATVKNFTVDVGIILEQGMNELQNIINLVGKSLMVMREKE